MEQNAKIYLAGHQGLVGSAIHRGLKKAGYTNIITRTFAELDLTNQAQTLSFFQQERPDYVLLAAAKVGGIMANSTYPAEFIYQNLMIACNVIDSAYKTGVKKLLNLGSSCIYPRMAPQPMKEEALLTGELEKTNEAYALAKSQLSNFVNTTISNMERTLSLSCRQINTAKEIILIWKQVIYYRLSCVVFI